MFKIFFREKALKTLKKIGRGYQLRINAAIDDLKLGKFNLRDIEKIRGTEFGYRLRIGRWRILFSLFSREKRIEIVDVFLKKGKENYLKRRKLIK